MVGPQKDYILQDLSEHYLSVLLLVGQQDPNIQQSLQVSGHKYGLLKYVHKIRNIIM